MESSNGLILSNRGSVHETATRTHVIVGAGVQHPTVIPQHDDTHRPLMPVTKRRRGGVPGELAYEVLAFRLALTFEA